MSDRLYARLLRLYPRRFRYQYAEAMLQTFRDRLRTEPTLHLWLDILRDLAISIPREHLRPAAALAEPGTYRFSREAIRRQMTIGGHGMLRWQSFAALALFFLVGKLGDAAPVPLTVVTLLLAALLTFGLWRVARRYRRYQLKLTADRLEVVFERPTPREVTHHEITRIFRTPGFGVAVQASAPRRSLWIPEALTGFDDVLTHLAQWTTVEELPSRHHGPIGWARILHSPAFLLAFLLALMVRTPAYVIAVTIVAAVPHIWMLSRMLKQPLRASIWPFGMLWVLALRLALTFLVNR